MSGRRRRRPPHRSRRATDGGYRIARASPTRIARRGRWRDVPIEDTSTSERIDPRVLSIALDDLLPRERVVAIDSGNFMGYPSMYLAVPDEFGFCMTQAFQSIGLGLATAIGAALAQPDRLPVAALGDGGALMSASELETVVRLGLPMVVVVYNDDAYGAEVHHFGPHGHDLRTVVFPDTDIAAIARGFGFEAVTVAPRPTSTLVGDWIAGRRATPAARRRQGRRRPPVLVARGSLPRALKTSATTTARAQPVIRRVMALRDGRPQDGRPRIRRGSTPRQPSPWRRQRRDGEPVQRSPDGASSREHCDPTAARLAPAGAPTAGFGKAAAVVLALLTAFALGAATMEAFGPRARSRSHRLRRAGDPVKVIDVRCC